MNEVTIKGEVKFVDEVREYGANGFRKQEVVVETGDGRWDNPIAVEFTKDNIEKSQGLKKGRPGHHRSPGQRPRMERSRRSDQMVHLHRRLQGGNRRWFGGGPSCSHANRPRQFFFRYLRRIRRRGGRRRFLNLPSSSVGSSLRAQIGWRGHRSGSFSAYDLKTNRKETFMAFS